MKKLGSGTFTEAYLKPDGRVKIRTIDCIKECMSMGLFPNSVLFPKVKFVGLEDGINRNVGNQHAQDHDESISIYDMEYYDFFSGYTTSEDFENALLPSHYKLYEELQELDSAWYEMEHQDLMDDNPEGLAEFWIKRINEIISNKHFKNSLLKALNAIKEYTSAVFFEAPSFNLAVRNKRLILMDCFFVMEKHNRSKRRYSADVKLVAP